MLSFVRITSENIDFACEMQQRIFPPELNARANYEESVNGITDFEYFIAYNGGTPVGISGFYHHNELEHDSAWLDWFGVLEQYRRRKNGTKIIRMFEELAVSRGYRFGRLFTDKDNYDAIAFYRANGYSEEDYQCPDDPACFKYPLLIFSKSLCGDELVPWNNRNIHFTEQVLKQSSHS